MNGEAFQQALDAMAAMPGCTGCAIADAATGMVWLHAGDAAFVAVAEAATDYWRLGMRHRGTFAALGGLRAQVSIHQAGRLSIVPCGPGLLLVCRSREPDEMDWKAWRSHVAGLQAAARRL